MAGFALHIQELSHSAARTCIILNRTKIKACPHPQSLSPGLGSLCCWLADPDKTVAALQLLVQSRFGCFAGVGTLGGFIAG